MTTLARRLCRSSKYHQEPTTAGWEMAVLKMVKLILNMTGVEKEPVPDGG